MPRFRRHILPCVLWAAVPFATLGAVETSTNEAAAPVVEGVAAARLMMPEDELMEQGRALLAYDPAQALHKFRAVLDLRPGHAGAQSFIATTLLKLGRDRDAEKAFLLLLAQRPDDVMLLNNLAWMYATSSDPAVRNSQQAIHYARQALMVAPEDYHVWSTLSEAYYTAGDYARALKAAEEALRAGQQSPNAEEYSRQVEKCRRTVAALTLIE